MHDAHNPRVRPRRRRAPIVFVLALLSAALVLLSACGGSDDSALSATTEAGGVASDEEAPADFATAGPDTAEEPMAEEEALPASPDELSSSQAAIVETALAVPTALTPADLGRDIVYRATISVQADDVTAASNEAVSIVRGLGGIVFSQTTRTEPQPRTEITFKVLPDDFSTALERLAGVGTLVDQSISADDVTERVVDLESRISTAEVSVDPPCAGSWRRRSSSRTWPRSSGSCSTARPPSRSCGASCAPCAARWTWPPSP